MFLVLENGLCWDCWIEVNVIDFLKSCNLEEYNRSTRFCLSYVGLATLVTFVQFTVMASSLFDMLHGGVAISVIGVIVERLWCLLAIKIWSGECKRLIVVICHVEETVRFGGNWGLIASIETYLWDHCSIGLRANGCYAFSSILFGSLRSL